MSKKAKPRIIPEKISLFSVNIFQANLSTEEHFLDDPQEVKGFEFGIAHQMGHNHELGRSRIRLYFSMDARDDAEQPLGVKVEYGIEFHFSVENFADFVQDQADGPTIEGALPATLLGMAYSTARGIIFERTRGTFFEGVILPVVDPFKLLVENGRE